jgi:hypothetical protein
LPNAARSVEAALATCRIVAPLLAGAGAGRCVRGGTTAERAGRCISRDRHACGGGGGVAQDACGSGQDGRHVGRARVARRWRLSRRSVRIQPTQGCALHTRGHARAQHMRPSTHAVHSGGPHCGATGARTYACARRGADTHTLRTMLAERLAASGDPAAAERVRPKHAMMRMTVLGFKHDTSDRSC